MGVPYKDLPASLRKLVDAQEPPSYEPEAQTRGLRVPTSQVTDSVPRYRCHDCGYEAPWGSSATTPKAWQRHGTETGHRRYEAELS